MTGKSTVSELVCQRVDCQRVDVSASWFNLPDNLPDKASPGETGSASRVTQTEIVYKVTHLYNVFPIAA